MAFLASMQYVHSRTYQKSSKKHKNTIVRHKISNSKSFLNKTEGGMYL
jgi:hypothetical protein